MKVYRMTVDNLTPIKLGFSGEDKVTAIEFDYSSWADEFGEGVLSAEFTPPKETDPIIINLDVSGHIATWTVTEDDNYKKGIGELQLIYITTSNKKKSKVVAVITDASLSGSDSDPPDRHQGWVDELVELGAVTIQNARDAAEYAAAAESAKDYAVEAKDFVEEYYDTVIEKSAEVMEAANTAITKASEAETSALTASSASDSAIAAKNQVEGWITTAIEKSEEASGAATVATTKANEASNSATIATNKASEASTSASEASISAGTATTKASEASASAEDAANSATIASNKAAEAYESANTATTNASEAISSAQASINAKDAAVAAKEAAETAAQDAENRVYGVGLSLSVVDGMVILSY